MPADKPHFLLYSETSFTSGNPRWKFVLQATNGNDRFAASDVELDVCAGRLELLAVVRGLEALDYPARVTLLTPSRYVSRGIRRELSQWREWGWRWERFGKLVPIRDHDLWRRVDRAMEFHQVECWGKQLEELTTEAVSMRPSFSKAAGARSSRPYDAKSWSVAAALGSLRRHVLNPLLAARRPAFTPAA